MGYDVIILLGEYVLTLTYSLKPSLTLIVAPVVQDRSSGSIKGPSVMLGWDVFKLVMNHVAPHLCSTSKAMSLTVSKCGRPIAKVSFSHGLSNLRKAIYHSDSYHRISCELSTMNLNER